MGDTMCQKVLDEYLNEYIDGLLQHYSVSIAVVLHQAIVMLSICGWTIMPLDPDA